MRLTSGFVTRCVGGMTPLSISHCLACLQSTVSPMVAILNPTVSSRDLFTTDIENLINDVVIIYTNSVRTYSVDFLIFHTEPSLGSPQGSVE